MKIILALACLVIFFSGCVSPQPQSYPSYNIGKDSETNNKDNYIIKKNTYYIEHIEDNREIDYQEMYFEGFGEEQEDLEYE